GLSAAFLTGIGQLQNLTLPRDRGKRIAAADHFAVTGEVRGDAVALLCPTPSEAKAGHDLVEDQHDAQLPRDIAQTRQEPWLGREGPLQGFDNQRGEFRAM